MKILIIEDSPESAFFLKTLLNLNNIENITATTGYSGLEIACNSNSNNKQIDLILLDIDLPDINGIEVCKKLKKNDKTKNIPVICLTALQEDEYLPKAFEAGAVDYFQKPYKEFVILPRIKIHLENYKLISELKRNNTLLNKNITEIAQISEKLNIQNKKHNLTEEKLIFSEKQFKLALKSADAGVFCFNLETGFLDWDERSLKMFGLTTSSFKNNYESWKNCLHPEDAEKTEAKFQKYLTSTENYLKLEFRIIKPNGEEAYILASTAVERNEKGKPLRVFGLHLNFTKRHNEEQELTKYKNNLEKLVKEQTFELETKRHELQLIFDNAPASMFLLDKNSQIINVNKTSLQFTGKSLDKIEGTKLGDIIDCVNSKKNGCGFSKACSHCLQRNIVNDTIKNNIPYTKVESLFTIEKDGETTKQIVNLSTVIVSRKPEIIILLTIDDITIQTEALIELKKSEETFRMLVENIGDVFWIFNIAEKKLSYMSKQSEILTGRSQKAMFDDYTSIIKNAHPEDRENLQTVMKEALKGKKACVEYRTITADNKIKWLFLKSFVHFDSNNKPSLLFGLVSDTTDQKQTERKVLHAILETENRERDYFAKELHDGLGANLSAIKMYLERLNSTDLKPEKRKFYSKYALDLITQAAQTSREISHKIKPHTLDNFGLIASIENLCEKTNALGKVKVKFKNKFETLKLDNETELAIYRILSELSNNSLKYANAKNIIMELKTTNNRLLINYYDDGIGIEFDINNIENSTGNGLKNIIARVNALAGKINFETNLNKGLNVNIQLTPSEFVFDVKNNS